MVYRSYNFTINKILNSNDLYESKINDSNKKIYRDNINLTSRFINHKQLIFNIILAANETKKFYIRLKNESSFYFEFAAYSPEKFF